MSGLLTRYQLMMAAGGSSPGWTPANLSTLAWFDAKNSSLSTDGQYTWQNLSPGGSNTTSASGPPAIRPSGMMGRQNNATWSFTVGTDFVPLGNTAYYIAAVLRTSSDAEMVALRQGTAAPLRTPHVGVRPTRRTMHNNYSADTYGQASSITIGQAFIVVATYAPGAGGDLGNKYTHLNGALDVTATISSLDTSSGSNYIGGFNNYNYGWVGEIGTIVSGPGPITTADRQKLEGYLAHHWEMSGVLPSDHPYKSAPPAF